MEECDDYDDGSDEGEVSFIFERLDVEEGPRIIASAAHRSGYSRLFRELNRRYGVRLISFDARRSDHPDRLAEDTALRQKLRSLAVGKSWQNHQGGR